MWAMINDDFDVNIKLTKVKLTNVMCHRHEYYNGPSNESEHLDKNQRIGLGHERRTSASCEVTLHYITIITCYDDVTLHKKYSFLQNKITRNICPWF